MEAEDGTIDPKLREVGDLKHGLLLFFFVFAINTASLMKGVDIYENDICRTGAFDRYKR